MLLWIFAFQWHRHTRIGHKQTDPALRSVTSWHEYSEKKWRWQIDEAPVWLAPLQTPCHHRTAPAHVPAWERCTRIGATVANWGHSKGSGTVTHLPSVLHLPSESVSQPIYLLHLIGKKKGKTSPGQREMSQLKSKWCSKTAEHSWEPR